jgi:hypothetical protein
LRMANVVAHPSQSAGYPAPMHPVENERVRLCRARTSCTACHPHERDTQHERRSTDG